MTWSVDRSAGRIAAGLETAFRDLCVRHGTAALAVRRGDEIVLELAHGHDVTGRPFTTRTPVFLYSAVKPAAALAVLLAAARREISLDEPVARVWGAFGVHGKQDVTVAQILCHAAAVPGWWDPISVAVYADHEAAADQLAAARPWWPPGEPGEHATSYGHLIDGLLGRATGRGVEAWWPALQDATGTAIDLVAGTGARRPAPLDDPGGAWHAGWLARTDRAAGLLTNPPELTDTGWINGPDGRRLVAPAVTGYASAQDLSALWSWWSGPPSSTVLGAQLHRRATRPAVVGHDHVLGRAVAWGLGPQFDDTGYGMGGIGGCVGWYDQRLDLSVGFTTSTVGPLDRLDPLDEALATLAGA